MRVVALAALALTAALASAQLNVTPPPGGVPSTVKIDPVLSSVLGSAGLDQPIQAVLTFDHYPTATDLLAIQATGVQVRPLRGLPMVGVQGTSLQIRLLPALPGLRSIYFNRQLDYFLDESVPLIGAPRVWNELGHTGKGVTVAVIDSGIDATHEDLPFGTKVVQNVKVAPDFFGSGPPVLEGLATTDTSSGHGTHVAGIAGGTGAALAGRYGGVAIGSQLVGIGAGEYWSMLTALEAFDWTLQNRLKYAIRVISNSWGTSGGFEADDPINVASKIAHDAGMVVVFAAGNGGPGLNTLNPYCVAPWVICAAAGHKDGSRLADFSSRGIPGDPLYQPTITAPGVDIASVRATTGFAVNVPWIATDTFQLGSDAVLYAVASGTSMATPHVSGTVALMLEANLALTPDGVKSVLQATATPMPAYERHEVGAGYLNAYDAVRAAQGR
jgi:serine protease AprX